MNKPLLELKNVSHYFKPSSLTLKNIHFQIFEGDFIVLTGTNGSGKTVLSKHLNGLIKPMSGEVFYKNNDIHKVKNRHEIRQKVGLVFQDSSAQFVGLTVLEEIRFGLLNLCLPHNEIDIRVEKVMHQLGITELKYKDPFELSGGQKRRIAIAGVLVMHPEIIVLDEPFTGLDYPSIQSLIELLVSLHEAGTTIVVITHELEKILSHANRLVVLSDGILVLDGKPSEVCPRLEDFGVRNPSKFTVNVDSLSWLR